MSPTIEAVKTAEWPKASHATGTEDHGTPSATPARQERRRQKRASVKLAARVRCADTMGQSFEVLVTVNASRQSLYFITSSEHYRVGLQVRVTFPYDATHDSVSAMEDAGEVTRTERLPGKRTGVAIQMRSRSQAQRTSADLARPSSPGAVTERRILARRPFSAEATVVDAHSNIRLRARCSDLSAEGCYVDTLNPFPTGTIARIILHTGDTTFETPARVNSSHIGMGMGICFQDLTAEQRSLLARWLNQEPHERIQVPNPPAAPSQQEEAMDRTLAISMVRHMIAKGILSKADVAEIFFNVGIIS